ncbi:MAG TPA: ABC transporter permease [Blastocatellia bacterium]|nr:ABC transporter permease [Blastocatellia bacterium]
MRWWHELRYLMRKLNRRRAERDAEEEIRTHLELETREQIEAGLSPEEAQDAARRAFGSLALAKEDSREVWGWRTLEIIGQDLRYGLRMMLKRPGFTLVAVGMLAIAIAANTAIFSIAEALILRPFNFPNQERLVMIWSQSLKAGYEHKYILNGVFADWQEQSRSFEQLIRYSAGFFELTGTSQPEQVLVCHVSANFFEALGVKAALGRTMQQWDDEPGRDQVVVLRHSFWQRRYGSDPEIVGKTVEFNRKPYTVIGVMPANFNFTLGDAQFWAPHVLDEKMKHSYDRALSAMGLLKPGVGIEQARAELDAIWQRAPQRYLEMNSWPTPQVIGMNEDFTRDKKMFLLPLIGTVAFMLLIVCANVANMLLGRALGRQKEIAVRLALGASRRRLIGQVLTESLLLAFAGGLIGLLLSFGAIGLLRGAIPDEIARLTPGFDHLSVNLTALLFTLLVSMLTGVIFGLAPAWQSSRPRLNEALKEGRKGASSAGGRGRLRGALVIAEVALSIILLIGAGLMLRSLMAMLHDDFGFKPQNVLSLQIMRSADYDSRERVRNFYHRLIERLAALPGVTAVGASDALPMGGNQNAVIGIVGRPPSENREKNFVDYRAVTPGYFNAIGTLLRRGRGFTAEDHERAPKVVIINESFARRFFPDQDAIGQRLIEDGEIVGIVEDARDDNLDLAAKPGFYAPFAQAPLPFMGIVLRSTVEPAALTASVRQVVAELDPAQPIRGFKTLDQRIYERTTPKRLMTVVMGAFAGAALLLAGIGLYAVMAYAVSQRTHEIGIRLALGAPRHSIIQLILGQGLKLTLAGMAIGTVVALALTRILQQLLYGISATDPLTFMLVFLMMAGAALLACWLPARRATRVDPMVALRCD